VSLFLSLVNSLATAFLLSSGWSHILPITMAYLLFLPCFLLTFDLFALLRRRFAAKPEVDFMELGVNRSILVAS